MLRNSLVKSAASQKRPVQVFDKQGSSNTVCFKIGFSFLFPKFHQIHISLEIKGRKGLYYSFTILELLSSSAPITSI